MKTINQIVLNYVTTTITACVRTYVYVHIQTHTLGVYLIFSKTYTLYIRGIKKDKKEIKRKERKIKDCSTDTKNIAAPTNRVR